MKVFAFIIKFYETLSIDGLVDCYQSKSAPTFDGIRAIALDNGPETDSHFKEKYGVDTTTLIS